MSRWDDNGTWEEAGLRREVFLFDSGGVQLYGSLYASTEPLRPFGLVACASWGVEADRTDPLLRSAVMEMARLGGAGLLFHYPGYGDSYGSLVDLELADLSRAAEDAAEEARRLHSGVEWFLAGFALGASVACLAQSRVSGEFLVLVQPELRPSAYFEALASRSEPLAPGPTPREMMIPGSAPGMAYGYPVSEGMRADRNGGDAAVAAALSGFRGRGAIISHPVRDEVEVAPHLERIEVPGVWRFGAETHARLQRAVSGWLDANTREAA